MEDIETGEEGGTFTETTHESWGARMKQSFGGVCIGLLLFFGSFALLIWNEGRAVGREKDLQEGINAVEAASSFSSIDSSQTGSLVYLTADIASANNEALIDPLLGVDANVLKMNRNVEMYQWHEKSRSRNIKTSAGGTRKETTYSYEKQWASSLINSNSFRTGGHVNPAFFLIDPLFLEADDIMLGAFTLGDAIKDRINWFTDYQGQINISDIADASLRSKAQRYKSNGLYFGNNPQSSIVGDSKVEFSVVLPDSVSIVAKQGVNGQLSTFVTSRGGELLLFRRGTYSSEELFFEAQADNVTTTWILRVVGLFLMMGGIMLVLQPIATFVDIIPCIGDFMEGSLQKCVFPLISFVIALPLSLFTIALAWIVYRPIVAGIIMGVTALIIAFFVKRTCDKKNAADKLEDDDYEQPPPMVTAVEVEDPYHTPSAPPQEQDEPEISMAVPYVPAEPYKPNQEPEIAFKP